MAISACSFLSSSSSSSSSLGASDDEAPTEHTAADDGADDSQKRTLVDQVKEYDQRKDTLHRKHRGLMQWERTRNIAWVKHEVQDKVGDAASLIKGRFKHQSKRIKMDKEV